MAHIQKAPIKRFEDMIAWQKAKLHTTSLYAELKSCPDYGFKDQMTRAAIIRSMLRVATELHFMSDVKAKELAQLSEDISRLLAGFIKTLDVRRSTFDEVAV